MSPRALLSESVARRTLVALALAPPLVFGARAALERTPTPQAARPTRAHLVVVTAGIWRGVPDPTHAGLARLEAAATAPQVAFAPSTSAAATATSLWTGRWPAHTGVVSARERLPAGTWTLATAARASGARTGAFLAEPFVSVTSVSGFDEVVEDPELDAAELGRRAAAFLDVDTERVALWLHLADSGPGGRAVGDVFVELERALGSRANDTVLLVCGFSSSGQRERGPEADARAPLWLCLPQSTWAGRRGNGVLSLIDVAGALRSVLRYEGGMPQSRAAAAALFQGGTAAPQILIQRADRHVLLLPGARVSAPGLPPAPTAELSLEDAGQWPKPKLARAYENFLDVVLEGATTAEAAAPPDGAARFPGWP